jgi:hypothetical protein
VCTRCTAERVHTHTSTVVSYSYISKFKFSYHGTGRLRGGAMEWHGHGDLDSRENLATGVYARVEACT